jgi:hypothetical protein
VYWDDLSRRVASARGGASRRARCAGNRNHPEGRNRRLWEKIGRNRRRTYASVAYYHLVINILLLHSWYSEKNRTLTTEGCGTQVRNHLCANAGFVRTENCSNNGSIYGGAVFRSLAISLSKSGRFFAESSHAGRLKGIFRLVMPRSRNFALPGTQNLALPQRGPDHALQMGEMSFVSEDPSSDSRETFYFPTRSIGIILKVRLDLYPLALHLALYRAPCLPDSIQDLAFLEDHRLRLVPRPRSQGRPT